MTYDFFMGQLRLALIAFLSYAGGKGWLQASDAGAIMAVVTPLAAVMMPVIWSWSANWRKKYVPSDSVMIAPHAPSDATAPAGSTVIGKVIGILIAAFLVLAFWSDSTRAADIAKAAPLTTMFGQPCTPTSCTGFYVGGQIGGAGTNADVIGNGVNGSVFAGGGIAAVNAGYQYAAGNWFAAAEAAVGYQFQTGATVQNIAGASSGIQGNGSGFLAYQIVKAGGNLSALLGDAPPISISPKLKDALISPYVLVGGVERSFATGWATGAGATFDIGPRTFVDVKYMYVSYGPSSKGAFQLSNENLLFVGLNYKF